MARKSTSLQNRRVRFDYELADQFTAGLVLHGFEVKSLRAGQADLNNAFVNIKDGEAWLINAHIRRYSHAASLDQYDPTRPRKLLLNSKELQELISAKQNKLTIVPLAILAEGRFVKLRLATARGKKLRDKRQVIKRREADRDVHRALKSRSK